ncbi:uncharacterized protein N7496_002703 [Penicillium cataractarum]|uniref:Uncharacterized protein n=1 Tax=Penicillium cataractarum TaxID=2100454 RepID=A0A9W9VI48_9EURO|nr:uncharacterized protein N7496_002703 [Penicillium cataractarum]KAJ5380275.1 hypothetical protein N7496_002703 [Penicillium cataractarum]
METTLSTFPTDDMDLMSPFYPSLNDINQDGMNDNMPLLSFDDIESATMYKALRNQEQELDTGLRHGNNIAEEPTTVAPLATLLSFDPSSSDSTTLSPVTTETTLGNKEPVTIFTPPTPISNSPTLQPAAIEPPAPVSVDVNQQNQQQEPRVQITPAMLDMVARHIHTEWIDLNGSRSSSTEIPDPTPITMDSHPVEHPRQVPTCHPMHYHGHRPIQYPMESSHFCPHHMFCPHMGHPLPQTYPLPSPAPRQPPVSNKRTFEFVEPEVPENFVANPNNHGRWQYDRSGNRHYLNAPKTKVPGAK